MSRDPGPAPESPKPEAGLSEAGFSGAGLPATVEIRVIPRARRDEVAGHRGGRLLVRTAAAPVDGKANDAVIRIVAAHLGVHRRRVEIVAGHQSRDKVLRIDP